MAVREGRYTVEAFVVRPENSEKRFEYIGGEIVEVPSNPFVSEIAGMILFFCGCSCARTMCAGT